MSRHKEKIVKGENIPEPGVPESFKVLLKELQAIGLDVQILNEDGEEVVIKELMTKMKSNKIRASKMKSVMSWKKRTRLLQAFRRKAASDTDDNGDDEYVDAGEEDDIMSSMTYETIPGQSDDMTDNEE